MYRGRDEKKAERLFKEYQEDFNRLGNAELLLMPRQRIDAATAMHILRGYPDVTLTELARKYTQSEGPGGEDLFDDAVKWFLEEYQWHLRRAAREFRGVAPPRTETGRHSGLSARAGGVGAFKA